MKVSKEAMKDMYLRMVRIREFESKAQSLFADGKIPGFVHLYLGEEAVATGVCECLRDDDYITSTHRGHGHIVAKGGDLKFMMAELYGKATGYCKGKGGSMHIADRDKGILGANGIVGAGHNIAVGAGLSAQYRGTDQVCVCFFGDASTNQGTFHESLNMAAIWKLPIIFVCENNNYGLSMSQARHQAIKDVADRGAAYGIPGIAVDGNDVMAVNEAAAEAVARARKGQGPTLLECKTYRWRGHFEGDQCAYRDKAVTEEEVKKDCLANLEKYVLDNGVLTQEDIELMRKEIALELEQAVEFAENSPEPDPDHIFDGLYA